MKALSGKHFQSGWTKVLLCLSLLAASLSLSVSVAEEKKQVDVLHAMASVTPFDVSPGQTVNLNVVLHLNDGYKAYEDQFKIKITDPAGFKIASYKIDPVKEFFDKNSNKTRRGVIGHANLTAVIEAPENLKTGKARLSITYQACTDTFCLFPKELNIPLELGFKAPLEEGTANAEKAFLDLSFKDVSKKGLPLTFLFVFIFGILTSFTPCHFPMIPITLAVLGKDAHVRTRWQNIAVSNVYVLGIATTYSALGVLAASTGALFGSFINSPAVTLIVFAVFTAMALSLFGLYELQAPQFIRDGYLAKFHRGGYLGAFLSGIIAGAVASPCVGPILVGVLTFVAQSQNLWLGFWLLFVYALGMGQLYLFLGVFSGLAKKLPKSGPWMDIVSHVFGLLLLGAAFYYLSNLLPTKWIHLMMGITIVVLSIWWGAFKNALNLSTFEKFKKLGLIAFCSFGIILLGRTASTWQKTIAEKNPSSQEIQALDWRKYQEQELQYAKSEGKAVLIDFYADWCAACKELENKTFTQPEVVELAKKIRLLRFDATNDSDELTALKKKYGIVGLPTIIFIDAKGNWRQDLTLTEFEEPAQFATRLKKL